MIRFSFAKRAILADHGPVATSLWTVAAVVVPTALRWFLDRGQSGVPFVTFFPAIVLAAVFLGWRAGTVTFLLCGVIGNRLFRHDSGIAYFDGTDAAMLGLYVLTCCLLVLIGDTLRRTVRELERSLRSEAILKDELTHRVKNTLSIVQSLANLTARTTEKAQFVGAFGGRLAALRRATDILTSVASASCKVADLIEEAVKPFRGDHNFEIQGPTCRVSRDCCVQLVLILHELCTNATKYGALTRPEGVISIDWDSTDGEVIMRWKETGGPPLSTPATLGMGTKLMSARPELIDVSTVFARKGVECRIVIKGSATDQGEERQPVRELV